MIGDVASDPGGNVGRVQFTLMACKGGSVSALPPFLSRSGAKEGRSPAAPHGPRGPAGCCMTADTTNDPPAHRKANLMARAVASYALSLIAVLFL